MDLTKLTQTQPSHPSHPQALVSQILQWPHCRSSAGREPDSIQVVGAEEQKSDRRHSKEHHSRWNHLESRPEQGTTDDHRTTEPALDNRK